MHHQYYYPFVLVYVLCHCIARHCKFSSIKKLPLPLPAPPSAGALGAAAPFPPAATAFTVITDKVMKLPGLFYYHNY